MAQLNYVPDATDQYKGYEPVPAGTYKVQIVDTEVIETHTDKGDGEMIKFSYEIIGEGPQFDGRKISDGVMIAHSNSSEAERIGKQKLNTLCVLTGIKSLKDTAQFHGKTLSLMVTVKKDKNGDDQNYIKKYLPFNDRDDAPDIHDEEQPRTAGKKPSFVKS